MTTSTEMETLKAQFDVARRAREVDAAVREGLRRVYVEPRWAVAIYLTPQLGSVHCREERILMPRAAEAIQAAWRQQHAQ